MTWDEELHEIISKKWKVGHSFSLEDIYQFENHFANLYPDNNYLQAKLRQTLQHLRNKGYIEFKEKRGHYTRIK